MVPADKATNNAFVVVCRVHYINTLNQELNGTKTYEEPSTDEKIVVNHLNELPRKFYVGVKERQDKLHTMYWLPNLMRASWKIGIAK